MGLHRGTTSVSYCLLLSVTVCYQVWDYIASGFLLPTAGLLGAAGICSAFALLLAADAIDARLLRALERCRGGKRSDGDDDGEPTPGVAGAPLNSGGAVAAR